MTEFDALYAAVLADPDADAPRLVLADYWDEHGEPDRAEFVRVQVERHHTHPNDRRHEALRRRANELFEGDWIGWWADACLRAGLPLPGVPRSAAGRLAARLGLTTPGRPYTTYPIFGDTTVHLHWPHADPPGLGWFGSAEFVRGLALLR
jgi:uncharacterized protein (TIGR02996 family)